VGGGTCSRSCDEVATCASGVGFGVGIGVPTISATDELGEEPSPAARAFMRRAGVRADEGVWVGGGSEMLVWSRPIEA
jgi:hypothetical protein